MIYAECYLIVLALVKKKRKRGKREGRKGERRKEGREKEGRKTEGKRAKKERKKKRKRFDFAESMWKDKWKFLCGVL